MSPPAAKRRRMDPGDTPMTLPSNHTMRFGFDIQGCPSNQAVSSEAATPPYRCIGAVIAPACPALRA